MKVMLTGGNGMLGRTLTAMLAGCTVVPTDLPAADITAPALFDALCDEIRPDVVIHCAAMTAVDKCEDAKELAYAINERGSRNVAMSCQRLGIRLIAMSTDYVFDGDGEEPYSEYDTPTGGVNVYGRSKWAGEEAIRAICPNHVITRISWLYGPGGPSFVHTMLRLADGSRPTLKVVDDQVGNPTSTLAVARELNALLVRPDVKGTLHMTCEGQASWAEFAKEIFRLSGNPQHVTPCASSEYPTPATRPANSRLEKRRIRECGLPAMPDWRDALAEFMRNM